MNVDQLLAAAASVNLKSQKAQPIREQRRNSPKLPKKSEEKEEKPAWENFLKKPEAKPENEDINSQL